MSESSSATRCLDGEKGSYLDVQQFVAEVLNEVNRIAGSERRRIATKDHLTRMQEYMLSIFDRLTVLFTVNVQTWERDRSIVTEVGIAIYDPRFQELALAPNIKSYHFIISENRDYRNGIYTPDHKDNFAGGDSYLLTALQTREVVDGLICHYFGPDFPMDCLFVCHGLRAILRALENIDIFIHPKVPTLDTKEVFSWTHGRGNLDIKNALLLVNQPYLDLFNAGNNAYYTTLVALKMCDPIIRRFSGIDYLKDVEERDEAVKFLKRPLNRSVQRTAPTAGVLEEMFSVGTCERRDQIVSGSKKARKPKLR